MDAVSAVQSGHHEGLEAWLVDTPHGRAAVSCFGGQLLSWQPAGHGEVMWLSPARQPLPIPIRGGTPVCWPYFSRQGQGDDVPSHGVVRTRPWRLAGVRDLPGGAVSLVLEPGSLEGLDLALRMELAIGPVLEQRLVTTNTGSVSRDLTQALHNYFLVGDVERVWLEGVAGCPYADKYTGQTFRQDGPWRLSDARDPGRCDRIYTEVGGSYLLHDPVLERRIRLDTAGSRSVVVWNPGQAGQTVPDIGPAWRRYLCVETANAGEDVVTLPPGGRQVLLQRITVERV